MIGITNHSPGIGDKIQFTSIPENYFRTTGKKIIDVDNCWVFDHNPYIVRGEKPSHVFDLWRMKMDQGHKLSQAERFCDALSLKLFLRHPRLYQFEENFIRREQVIVHTNGKSAGGEMSDEVIESIRFNYSDYRIIQIGGVNDRKTPFIQKLGLGLWESSYQIATSAIFIGVNSSMMNIAKCYPRVRRKVLVQNLDLLKFYPSSIHEHWIDYGWEYFNSTQFDQGVTMSHLKI